MLLTTLRVANNNINDHYNDTDHYAFDSSADLFGEAGDLQSLLRSAGRASVGCGSLVGMQHLVPTSGRPCPSHCSPVHAADISAPPTPRHGHDFTSNGAGCFVTAIYV